MRVFYLISIITVAIGQSLMAQYTNEGVLEYINRNTISFDLPIEQTSDRDFQKLNFDDNIRVFGLGEANHGTKEFQLLKLKLAMYLIEENGLNTIILEFPYAQGLLLDRYVKGEDENGLKILTGQENSVYDNADFIELINSIKEMNENRSEKISFLGGDIFGKPTAIKLLRYYFHRVDSSQEVIFTEYQQFEDNTYLGAFQQDKKEFATLSKKLGKILKRNRVDYIKKSSEAEFRKASRLAESLGIKWKRNARAISFFDNVMRTLSENPTNKILVLAHNTHIGMLYNEIGSLLKNKLGDQYFSIGTDYEEGAFTTWNLKDSNHKFMDTLYTPKFENGFANKFSQLKGEFHYIPLNGAKDINADWVENKMYIVRIGRGFNTDLSPVEFREKVYLTKYFDALFVFRQIHPIILE